MLEQLRAWLNGSREYFTGVVLFSRLSKDARLVSLLKTGPTPFNTARLEAELLSACNHLKQANEPAAKLSQTDKKPKGVSSTKGEEKKETEPVNPVLYQAAKNKADLLYKEAMNLRAELFAMARVEDWEAVNQPDRVQKRGQLAIDVVEKYIQASELYDQADHVRETGRMPADQEAPPDPNYGNIPDVWVYYTLDNLRKNYNKQVKKDQSPERVARLQQQLQFIKTLEDRWHLLKPTN